MPIPFPTLTDELRSFVRGELLAEPLARSLYATDASLFEIQPAAVVMPADRDDLRNVVRFAFERSVPIVPRGAGTGLAGESLGAGIILDLSVHFRGIGPLTGNLITVEPGVTLAELNAHLAQHGRRFAPDPASGAVCTIGGMIATNASGGTAFRHGYTREHTRAIESVLDTGELWSADAPIDPARATDLHALLADNRQLIATHQPRTRFNRCGYQLHDLDSSDPIQLAKLLVGSEGTLGIVTRATLSTIPLAGGIAQFVVGFESFDAALESGPALRQSPGMVGCDVLDQRLLSLAKVPLVPANVGAVLIGTIEADTEQEAVQLGNSAIESMSHGNASVVIQSPTADPTERQRISAFRESAVNGLYALGRGRRPAAFIEDIAVPAEHLVEFVTKVQELLRSEEINASYLVHLLAAQVHTRPLLDATNPLDRSKMWPLADRVHALALALGGTISTQHGVGLARTPWVEKQCGPLLPVFRELKRIFDPKNILNPGKILGPDPSRPAWPMADDRDSKSDIRNSNPELKLPRRPLLTWNGTSPEEEAAKCNGCGDCRPHTGTVRMCPIFRASGQEAATPRAKANLFGHLNEKDRLECDDFAAIARLCVGCRMCREECRAKVDIPKLMFEAKAARYEEQGFHRREWLIARAESLVRFAGQFSWTMNTLLGMRWSRWLLEKGFGLSRKRLLPRFTHRTFLRRAWWSGWTRRANTSPTDKKVAYFVDVYANYCDPSIGEAAVAVLAHHGYEVLVPWGQRGSGITPLTFGDADTARDVARKNLRVLAELVRDGYTIVCSEPAAALALTQDYPILLGDPDAELVARNTMELMAFLNELQARGEFKTPTRPLPIGLGHHVPCHIKALGKPVAAPALLSTIPGATVDTIDDGCSGMAGTWGLSARNHETSLKVGAAMIAALDRPRILYGSTECSACRLQMREATGKRTLHPVQWLAWAYGLLEVDLT